MEREFAEYWGILSINREHEELIGDGKFETLSLKILLTTFRVGGRGVIEILSCVALEGGGNVVELHEGTLLYALAEDERSGGDYVERPWVFWSKSRRNAPAEQEKKGDQRGD